MELRHAFQDAREKLDTFGLGFLMNIVDAAWRLSPKAGFAWDSDTAALTTVNNCVKLISQLFHTTVKQITNFC